MNSWMKSSQRASEWPAVARNLRPRNSWNYYRSVLNALSCSDPVMGNKSVVGFFDGVERLPHRCGLAGLHGAGFGTRGRRAGASRFGLPPDTGSNNARCRRSDRVGRSLAAFGFGRRGGGSSGGIGLPVARAAVKKPDNGQLCVIDRTTVRLRKPLIPRIYCAGSLANFSDCLVVFFGNMHDLGSVVKGGSRLISRRARISLYILVGANLSEATVAPDPSKNRKCRLAGTVFGLLLMRTRDR